VPDVKRTGWGNISSERASGCEWPLVKKNLTIRSARKPAVRTPATKTVAFNLDCQTRGRRICHVEPPRNKGKKKTEIHCLNEESLNCCHMHGEKGASLRLVSPRFDWPVAPREFRSKPGRLAGSSWASSNLPGNEWAEKQAPAVAAAVTLFLPNPLY
jgi:hypothetical protein